MNTEMKDAPPAIRRHTLIAATVGCTLGYGNLAVVSFGLFVIPLSANGGWSRGGIAFAVTLMTLGSMVSAPAAGALCDRFGTRRVALPAIVLLASVFLLLSSATRSLTSFQASYALLGLVAGGTMPTTYTRSITHAFDARRGLALSIALTGTGAGAIVLPMGLSWVIATQGVEAGYRILSLLAILALVPVYLLLPSDRMGKRGTSKPKHEPIGDLLRSQSFMKIAGAGLLLGVLTGTIWGGLLALLVDHGVEPRIAQLTMSGLAAALVVGRLVTGYLLDRFFGPLVAACSLVPVLIGLGLLLAGASDVTAVIAAVLLGIGIGAEFDFLAYLCGRYFPRQVYGRIYGASYCVFLIGAAAGPLMLALTTAEYGTDRIALALVLAGITVAIVLLLSLGRYPQFPNNEEDRSPDTVIAADSCPGMM